jgi:hypothetical protein
MAITDTISRAELEALTVEELKERLVWDRGNSQAIRDEIGRKRARPKPPNPGGIHSPPPQKPPAIQNPSLAEFRDRLYKVINEGYPVLLVVDYVRKSDWDRTDPKRLMRKEPWEVDNFLNALTLGPQYYKDLSPGQQNFFTMIMHSFERWLHEGRLPF